MTAETNKIVVHRFLEFINTGSESLARELISPDAIFHIPGSPEPMRGPAGYLAIIGMMRGGFPDIKWTLEEMVAEGRQGSRKVHNAGHSSGHISRRPTDGKNNRGSSHEYLPSVGRIVRRRTWPAGYAWAVTANRRGASSLENCGPRQLT